MEGLLISWIHNPTKMKSEPLCTIFPCITSFIFTPHIYSHRHWTLKVHEATIRNYALLFTTKWEKSFFHGRWNNCQYLQQEVHQNFKGHWPYLNVEISSLRYWSEAVPAWFFFLKLSNKNTKTGRKNKSWVKLENGHNPEPWSRKMGCQK